jgi:hypothetical protein
LCYIGPIDATNAIYADSPSGLRLHRSLFFMSENIADDISSLYDEAERSHKEVRSRGFSWDDREDMFFGRYKNAKEDTKSVYSTGELQGMVFDSSCRVMGQMATGRFSAVADESIANVIAANLVFHHYMIPNANKGGDFFTKMRMANYYSKLYGTQPTFIEPIFSEDYNGTDAVLIPARRFKPQPGVYVIEDMEHCFAEVPVTLDWLQRRAKNSPEVWKNIDGVKESDLEQASLTTEERKSMKNQKLVVLRHYFNQDGDWIIWDAVSKIKIVDEKGFFPCIPFVEKQTIPLLDRFWCLGDYERGETPQKSLDTITRLFLDGWALGNEPPLIMDPEEVVLSSIVRAPRAKWFVKNGNVNGIQPARINLDGMSQFQVAHSTIKANLLSLGAQTDTSISKATDVGFGKTPEALKQQSEREGARDSWDRYMQERYLEKVANMMIRVAIHRGFDKVEIKNIAGALEKLKSAYPEKELTLFQSGKINKQYLKGKFKYEVDPGSSMKRDDAGAKMFALLLEISKNPKIEESILADKKRINWGEAIKRVAIEQGIPDWDKIIVSSENPESINGIGDTGSTIPDTNQEGVPEDTQEGPSEPIEAPMQVSPQGNSQVTPAQIAAIAQTL